MKVVKTITKRNNRDIMLGLDLILIIGSLISSFLIRFEFSIPDDQQIIMLKILPVVLILKLIFFHYFGLYRGMWRYTGFPDILKIFQAVVTANAASFLVILLLSYSVRGIPRSIFVIDTILSFFMVGGLRMIIRLQLGQRDGPWIPHPFKKRNGKRIIILGAGKCGELIIREIGDNRQLNLVPIGLLDDEPHKHGRNIHGVPILGSIDQLSELQDKFDEIIIAIPSAKGHYLRRIVALCKNSGKPFNIVPSLCEVITGKTTLQAARKVTVEDIFGREEVTLDHGDIEAYLKGKRVLVTGAGGSIGSELVKQICRFQPEAVGLLEMNEYNLFQIENECHRVFPGTSAIPILADIRNSTKLEKVFDNFKPDTVFHAAAYKHVPMQELFPWEAVENNVLGTLNLVEASKKFQVKRFVLVSTDKAVRPTNVMGATKRVAEMLIESCNGSCATRFMAVRFGNVMGSSGSVIPIFEEQIARGGPVTVTHPEITRYFMTISEAAQLILQAGAMGQGREIFILDMGKPMRILDLATDLIRLQGYEPNKDIEIKFTGLRPGEKLYEELITKGENIVSTHHEKIMVLKGSSCNHNNLLKLLYELQIETASYDAQKIKKTLLRIAPDYMPSLEEVDHKGHNHDRPHDAEHVKIFMPILEKISGNRNGTSQSLASGKTDLPSVIFGLRDYPRPRAVGFLYYKLPPFYKEKHLVDLNLEKGDEKYLYEVLLMGVCQFIKQENLSEDRMRYLLNSYNTEHMDRSAFNCLGQIRKSILELLSGKRTGDQSEAIMNNLSVQEGLPGKNYNSWGSRIECKVAERRIRDRRRTDTPVGDLPLGERRRGERRQGAPRGVANRNGLGRGEWSSEIKVRGQLPTYNKTKVQEEREELKYLLEPIL